MSNPNDGVETPWSQVGGNQVLFILDAGHDVEQELLRSWVDETRSEAHKDAKAERVTLSMSRAKGSIDPKPISQALQAGDDTLVVPLRVVWMTSDKPGGNPKFSDLLLGDPRLPGPKRAKQILRRHPERAHKVVGKPATIGELKANYTSLLSQTVKDQNVEGDQFSSFVIRQADLVLDIAERHLQGSRYKVPRFVAQNLKVSKKYNEAVEDLAKDLGKQPAELHAEAEEYFKELVAVPSKFYIDLSAKFCRFVLGLGYENQLVYDQAQLDRVKAMVRDNPSLLLWTHKTYLDGIVLPRIMYEHDFPMPHMFGGVNMSFALLGFVMRRSGAIFIRRTFQDNPLYKLVLRYYIGYLMEKRFPVNWSFEGTRSRVGKLMPPRFGLLKYVLEGAHATQAENIHIVPVTISYDLIHDVEEFAGEQTGRVKKPESLKWFIGYLSGLRRPMGRIYLDFGEPVVLPKAPDPDDRMALYKVAFQVGVEANKVTPVTLPSIITLVLLGAAPQALTVQEINTSLDALISWMKDRGIKLSDDIQLDNPKRLRAVADIMINDGLLTCYDEGPERVYAISYDQHPEASYYRNIVIHYFVNKAIIELALLKMADHENPSIDLFWAEAEHIRDLFKFEFFYAPTEEFREELKAELNRHDPDWESVFTSNADSILHLLRSQPLVAHGTLLNFVEAYTVVCDIFSRLKPGENLDQKTCTNQALKYGKQMYLQRRISSEASIGKVLFDNCYKLIENLKLDDDQAEDVQAQRLAFAQQFRDIAKRLERIRAMAIGQYQAPK